MIAQLIRADGTIAREWRTNDSAVVASATVGAVVYAGVIIEGFGG